MLTERDAQKIINDELKFPPFEITVRRDIVWEQTTRRLQPDVVLSIAFEGVSKDFAAEYKSSGGLANLRAAITQAKALAYANSNRALLPMVLVPFLRPQALDELIAEKTSGIDLCGNGVLYAPGAWFAYRTGAKNRFPATTLVKNPYRGEQSIIARALLTRGTFETQTEMVAFLAEFKVAPSTASKVLSALEEDLVVSKKPRIAVSRADILLQRLRENYSPPNVRNRRLLRLELTDGVRQAIEENAKRKNVLYAVASPERYTILPRSIETTRILTTDIAALLEGLNFRDDERFPTVEMIEIDSKVPFFGREFEGTTWWTSPLQEYLALSGGGKREQEAATAIRQRLLPASQP